MSCIKQIRLANTVFSVSSTMHMEVGGFLPQFETSDDADINIHVRYAEPGEETPDAHGYAKIEYDDGCFKVAIPQGAFPVLQSGKFLPCFPFPNYCWNVEHLYYTGPVLFGMGRESCSADPLESESPHRLRYGIRYEVPLLLMEIDCLLPSTRMVFWSEVIIFVVLPASVRTKQCLLAQSSCLKKVNAIKLNFRPH